jgi:PPOX class probable F420-dependent enzyme
MDDETMRRLVRDARVARLATRDADGRPHLVPISFALAEDTVYSAVDSKPKRSRRLARMDNVRADPRVAVLVDHYEADWSRLWWVRLRGMARVVEEGRELDLALNLLEAKYEQYRDDPPTGPALAVSIGEWRGWAASEEAP